MPIIIDNSNVETNVTNEFATSHQLIGRLHKPSAIMGSSITSWGQNRPRMGIRTKWGAVISQVGYYKNVQYLAGDAVLVWQNDFTGRTLALQKKWINSEESAWNSKSVDRKV